MKKLPSTSNTTAAMRYMNSTPSNLKRTEWYRNNCGIMWTLLNLGWQLALVGLFLKFFRKAVWR